MTVKSPCISVCAMDEARQFCKGCLRTAEEVAHWLYYTDEQKRQVLQRLQQRGNQGIYGL